MTAELGGELEVVKVGACSLSSDQQMKAIKADIVWTLNAFSTLANRKLNSPDFDIQCGNVRTRWHLELNMRTDDIGLYLAADKNASSIIEHRAHKQFTLGGEGEFELVKNDYAKSSHVYTGSYGWWQLIKRDVLQATCVQNNKLVVKASITVYHSHPEDYRNLIGSMALLFEDQQGDFTVRCEGKSIKVSKALLSKSSPVFEGMLSANMREAKKGFLTIKDLDFATVQAMIKFIYFGSISDTVTDVSALLIAANKYLIDGLKQQCQDRLMADLSVANVCQMLSLADLHNAFALKTAAINLISDKTEAVMATDGWKTILEQNGPLMTYLFAEVVNNLKN